MESLRRKWIALVNAGALAACSQSAPQGQIAATVNGEDITDGEVRAEMGASPTPIDRNIAMQRVITRKLLAQYGRENEIDKDPALLLDQRRMQENMLAERTMESVARKVRPPTQNDAADYLVNHNDLYANRQQFVVDELVVPEASIAGKVALSEGQSVDSLARFLTERKIAFMRHQTQKDTATTNPDTAKALAGKPVGSITVLSLKGLRGYFQVLQERSLPMDKPAAIALVSNQLSNQSAQMAVSNLEKQLRKQAKIALR